MKPRDLLDLVLLAALWGGSFLLMRVAAPAFGAASLAGVRVAVAAGLLVPWLVWRGSAPLLRRHAAPIALVGVVNSALPFALFSFALLHVNAGLAAVLNATAPMFGALIAWLWLAERPSTWRLSGLAVGFAGVVLLVWERIGQGSAGWAVAACLLASVCYGLAANYTRVRLAGVESAVIAGGSQLGAALALAPLAWAAWPAEPPSAGAWAAVLTLGIACTGLAYLLYFRLIDRVGPARAIAVTFLVPMFGIAFGALFLGEAIGWRMIAGSAVVLLGTALATGLLRRR